MHSNVLSLLAGHFRRTALAGITQTDERFAARLLQHASRMAEVHFATISRKAVSLSEQSDSC